MEQQASSMETPPAVAAPQEKGLRGWVLKALNSKHVVAAMATVAVVDGSFFPVPPFALLGPMVLAQPRKAPFYALVGTVASLAGGFLGYGLGHFAGEWVTQVLGVNLEVHMEIFNKLSVALSSREMMPGLAEWLHMLGGMSVGQFLSSNILILALLASVLPTPFKVVAIGAGMLNVNIFAFALAALFGRTARMFGFCIVVAVAREWATKRFKLAPAAPAGV